MGVGGVRCIVTAGERSSVTFTPDERVWAAASEAGSSVIGGGAWEFVAELLSSSSASTSSSAPLAPSIPSAVYSIAAGVAGAAGDVRADVAQSFGVFRDVRADVAVAITVENAGSYHLVLGLARAGGLLGAYYTNVWFRGDPLETRIDPSVSMDWGDGVASDQANLHSGVRWCGYLSPMDTFSLPSLPPSDAARGLEYTLTLELGSASDSARLWVNGTLLIDAPAGTAPPGRARRRPSGRIRLPGSSLASVTLEYTHASGTGGQRIASSGSGGVRLTWSNALLPEQAVPPEHLFSVTPAAGASLALLGTAADMYSNRASAPLPANTRLLARLVTPGGRRASVEGNSVEGVGNVTAEAGVEMVAGASPGEDVTAEAVVEMVSGAYSNAW
ncbi:hypothetical protein T484DRAFT_1905157 [Baffinella frigidus]|nr:hypothetical protein T484DRAFT_1905157 [Cryptophyta sp. CCMP2293]